MNTETPEQDPVAKAMVDIGEMVASARAVKGAIFAEVATAWFEALQATKLIAGIRVATDGAGCGLAAKCDAVAHLIGTSSARIVGLLGDIDGAEAMTLSKRLMGIFEKAQASAARGASS